MITKEDKFNHFSINDQFWIQIKEHLISFGFKSLPKDIHFTISFNKEKSDVNFHITKNSSEQNNKPKIGIVIIDKNLLLTEFNSLFLTMFLGMFKKVNIDKLKDNSELEFISFDKLKKNDLNSKFQQKIFENFIGVPKIRKKTRLKITGDLGKRLVDIATSDEMFDEISKSTSKFDNKDYKEIEGGVLVSGDNVLHVIKIYEQWYEFDSELKPLDILSNIMDEKLTIQLFWRVKRSIIYLKKSNTYNDTKHLNNPIRLELNASR